ncbi:MAG: cytochrome c [Hyphomicrobiales bacterium]|nr:cytochrome c [Hyphomicrobiales bacterium]MCP5373785.1 cytochrome c [Hyphomicrobiales bacterium]
MARLVLILAAALAAWSAAAAAGPDAARQKELLYMLKHDCGSCHGMTLKGGLGPALLPENLRDRADEDLHESIVNGHPGTAMPPWGPLLGPGEARWLVTILRQGAGQGGGTQ